MNVSRTVSRCGGEEGVVRELGGVTCCSINLPLSGI